jgi:hypothetical protein
MNNISEPTFFTEKNLVIVAIVIVTVIILKATFDTVRELFIQKNDDNLVNNLSVNNNIITYTDNEADEPLSNPLTAKGLVDINGNKIMVMADKLLVDASNNVVFDPVAFNFFDETGKNPVKLVKESDLSTLKTQYTTLEEQMKKSNTQLVTAEESSKDFLEKLAKSEENLMEQEEDITLKNDILLYGGIAAGVILLLCILFTYLYFKK